MLQNACRLLRICSSLTEVSRQNNAVNRIKRFMCIRIEKKLEPEDTFGSEVHGCFYEEEKEKEAIPLNLLDSVREMKSLLDKHDYNGAKAILREIQTTRKAPTYCYKLLISYNARLGYVKEAYRLYGDYKRRQYCVRGAIYTALFTACAKCPRTDIALPIADKVAKHLFESKDHKPNISNYHSMIMAYGRHGDISVPLQLVDKLQKQKVKLGILCYNYLLDACLSDKCSGLRYALLIWHQMLQRSIKPNKYTFEIMARCIGECSLGDVELIHKFVEAILEGRSDIAKLLPGRVNPVTLVINVKDVSKSSSSREKENYFGVQSDTSKEVETHTVAQSPILANRSLVETEEVNSDADSSVSQEQQDPNMIFCNLLAPKPQIFHNQGSVIGFSDFSKPENRFMLFGGLKGFLGTMSHFNLKPNIALFTLLLQLIPSTTDRENELLELIKQYKVKIDTIFMNVLIRRKIKRNDEFTIEDFLNLLKKYRLKPDIITFGTLALMCKDIETGQKCLQFANKYNIRLNSHVLTSLLTNAGHSHDMNYVSLVLNTAKEENIELDPKFVLTLKKIVTEEKKKRYLLFKSAEDRIAADGARKHGGLN